MSSKATKTAKRKRSTQDEVPDRPEKKANGGPTVDTSSAIAKYNRAMLFDRVSVYDGAVMLKPLDNVAVPLPWHLSTPGNICDITIDPEMLSDKQKLTWLLAENRLHWSEIRGDLLKPVLKTKQDKSGTYIVLLYNNSSKKAGRTVMDYKSTYNPEIVLPAMVVGPQSTCMPLGNLTSGGFSGKFAAESTAQALHKYFFSTKAVDGKDADEIGRNIPQCEAAARLRDMAENVAVDLIKMQEAECVREGLADKLKRGEPDTAKRIAQNNLSNKQWRKYLVEEGMVRLPFGFEKQTALKSNVGEYVRAGYEVIKETGDQVEVGIARFGVDSRVFRDATAEEKAHIDSLPSQPVSDNTHLLHLDDVWTAAKTGLKYHGSTDYVRSVVNPVCITLMGDPEGGYRKWDSVRMIQPGCVVIPIARLIPKIIKQDKHLSVGLKLELQKLVVLEAASGGASAPRPVITSGCLKALPAPAPMDTTEEPAEEMLAIEGPAEV